MFTVHFVYLSNVFSLVFMTDYHTYSGNATKLLVFSKSRFQQIQLKQLSNYLMLRQNIT